MPAISLATLADVVAPIEQAEQFADLAIDPRYLVQAVPDVDRGIVRLVIDEQHRLLDRVGAELRIVHLQPVDQIPERARVLLDHEHGRLAEILQRDVEALGNSLVKVPVSGREGARPLTGIVAAHAKDGLLEELPSGPCRAAESGCAACSAVPR